ncbi:hypothetical protein MAR_024795 [Mya arenaria]|uniref:Uncharacterized protein n=1 Tax=Mya arenaria TaxID=6604 RepID=A0ABY7DRU8_MYAAR|nr:hypothetical protein MAR_024795 [Mya arenaria]
MEKHNKILHITMALQSEKKLNLDKRKINELESEISSLRVALRQYEQENDELRTRLSRLESDRLLNNNPNIAYLSDPYRPTKIAEQFSEFYDTVYTGAYEKLLELNMTEVEATNLLFNILMIPSDKLEQFKDIRKKQFKQFLPDLQKTIFERVLEVWIPDACRRTAEVMLFVENATEICWLISIQDPPLCLVGEVNADDCFDKSMFREYTKRGPRLERRSTQIEKRFVSRISIVTSTGVDDLIHDTIDRSSQSETSEGIVTETGVNCAQVTTPVRPPRSNKAKQKETKKKPVGVERNGTYVTSSSIGEPLKLENDTSGSINEVQDLDREFSTNHENAFALPKKTVNKQARGKRHAKNPMRSETKPTQ